MKQCKELNFQDGRAFVGRTFVDGYPYILDEESSKQPSPVLKVVSLEYPPSLSSSEKEPEYIPSIDLGLEMRELLPTLIKYKNV